MSLFLLLTRLAEVPKLTDKLCACGGQVERWVERKSSPEYYLGMYGVRIPMPDTVQWRFQCTKCKKSFTDAQFDSLISVVVPR